MTSKHQISNGTGEEVEKQAAAEPEWRVYQLAAPDTPEPLEQYVSDVPLGGVDCEDCNEVTHATYAATVAIIGNVRVASVDGEEIIEWRKRGSERDGWRLLDLEDVCPVGDIHRELWLHRRADPDDPWLERFIEDVWSDVKAWIERYHDQAPIHVGGWCWILPVHEYHDQVWYAQPQRDDDEDRSGREPEEPRRQ